MTPLRPLYIFDLDGTLALIGHRRHFVEGETKDWPAFYAACVDDEPNLPVLETLFRLHATGADVWIWSGRSDEVRAQTQAWLARHKISLSVPLLMRKQGDHRPDDQLKALWFDLMLPKDRERLVAVFDDRDRLVKMWRGQGVACFQVAEGAF